MGLLGTAGAPPLSLSAHASLGHDVCLTHTHSLPVEKPMPYLRPQDPHLYKETHPSFLLQLLLCYLDQALALPRPEERVCCRRLRTQAWEPVGIGFPPCCAVWAFAHGRNSLSLILLLSQVVNGSFLDERDEKRAFPTCARYLCFFAHEALHSQKQTNTRTHTQMILMEYRGDKTEAMVWVLLWCCQGTTEDEMVGWHQWHDGHEFE